MIKQRVIQVEQDCARPHIRQARIVSTGFMNGAAESGALKQHRAALPAADA